MNQSLYRLSLKCLIVNEINEVLVVKENGRTFWDLPGGGMDHGESVKSAITRELREEVGFEGDFSFQAVAVNEPTLLDSNIWQVRVIFTIQPDNFDFTVGEDADEIRFMSLSLLKKSREPNEQRLYQTLKEVL